MPRFGCCLQVTWKECLSNNAAWDTLTWFAALIGMASYLNKYGFIKWFSGKVCPSPPPASLLCAALLLASMPDLLLEQHSQGFMLVVQVPSWTDDCFGCARHSRGSEEASTLQVVNVVSSYGLSWQSSFGIIVLLYFYSHYLFASGAAHIGAMYTAFLSVAVACGTPGLLAAVALGQVQPHHNECLKCLSPVDLCAT